MTEEKRTSHSAGSSDFISLYPLKPFFSSSNVSDVLMVKNQGNSIYSLSTDVLSDSTDVLYVLINVLSDLSEDLINSTLNGDSIGHVSQLVLL